MGHNILIAHKERERAFLLQRARQVVEAVESKDRSLSPEEDAIVTGFLQQAQALEHEINLLQRDRKRAIPARHRKVEDA